MSGADIVEELQYSGEVAGESFTLPLRRMPYDRPPEIVDPEILLERVFYALGKEKSIRKTMALLKAGIPIDMIVAPLLSQLAGEGKTTPHVATLIAPAVTIMIARMAEAAGVDYKLSLDSNNTKTVTEEDIAAAKIMLHNSEASDNAKRVNEMSSKELVNKSKKISLMQRPKELL